jgi:twitching motility two-component system response regulator PilG
VWSKIPVFGGERRYQEFLRSTGLCVVAGNIRENARSESTVMQDILTSNTEDHLASEVPEESAPEAGEDSLAGLRVMVIDDSKTIRRTAETLLKKAGCDVVTATDGFEALAKIADQKPDIIFVDIMMPRLDGYQTCALIKNNEVFSKTPVIMLSSKDGLFDRARGRIVGSEQYLTKPFAKEELLGAIKRHVTQD